MNFLKNGILFPCGLLWKKRDRIELSHFNGQSLRSFRWMYIVNSNMNYGISELPCCCLKHEIDAIFHKLLMVLLIYWGILIRNFRSLWFFLNNFQIFCHKRKLNSGLRSPCGQFLHFDSIKFFSIFSLKELLIRVSKMRIVNYLVKLRYVLVRICGRENLFHIVHPKKAKKCFFRDSS